MERPLQKREAIRLIGRQAKQVYNELSLRLGPAAPPEVHQAIHDQGVQITLASLHYRERRAGERVRRLSHKLAAYHDVGWYGQNRILSLRDREVGKTTRALLQRVTLIEDQDE